MSSVPCCFANDDAGSHGDHGDDEDSKDLSIVIKIIIMHLLKESISMYGVCGDLNFRFVSHNNAMSL